MPSTNTCDSPLAMYMLVVRQGAAAGTKVLGPGRYCGAAAPAHRIAGPRPGDFSVGRFKFPESPSRNHHAPYSRPRNLPASLCQGDRRHYVTRGGSQASPTLLTQPQFESFRTSPIEVVPELPVPGVQRFKPRPGLYRHDGSGQNFGTQ
eukprot:756247-Hanusia_phi.AAC.6